MKNELVELQEKLNGVYDLTDVVDCQSIIRMLLLDMRRERSRTEVVWSKLQELSRLVIDSKGCEPEIQCYAHGVLKERNGTTKHDAVDYLRRVCELAKQTSALDDRQLIDDAIDVWGRINMDTKESAVIEELIERYRQARGITDVVSDKVPEVSQPRL